MVEMWQLVQARKFVRRIWEGFQPVVSITIGSVASMAHLLEDGQCIEYSRIPGCPSCAAPGHPGRLWWGKIGGVPVVMLEGRKHLYEGVNVHKVVFLTRLMAMLGVKKFIITHAVGALVSDLEPTNIVAVIDQIGLDCDDPTSGSCIFSTSLRRKGVVFSPVCAFNPRFVEIAQECVSQAAVVLKKGVSIFKRGRTYETAAEGRAMATLGGTVVTMSTIPEIMALSQMGIGMEEGSGVLDLALVTDMVANVRKAEEGHVSQGEVDTVANRMKGPFGEFVAAIVPKLAAL